MRRKSRRLNEEYVSKTILIVFGLLSNICICLLQAQKKIETGKTGLTGGKTSSTSTTSVAQSGGGEDPSKKDIGKGPSEQTKSLAKAQRSARDKVITVILTKVLSLFSS